jgi:SH2 domain-containing protein 4A
VLPLLAVLLLLAAGVLLRVQMYVDPDLLAELNAEQKEVLFHKIREEQVRRWVVNNDAAKKAGAFATPVPCALKWDACADMLPDDVAVDPAAVAKKLAALEQERQAEEQRKDEEEARALASIEVQRENERRELEEKKALAAQIAKAKQEAIERELYMSAKEAKKAEEDEIANQKRLEAEAAKKAAARAKDYERVSKAKENEIYMDMQQVREDARRRRAEAESKMEVNFKESQAKAKVAEEKRKSAVMSARAAAGSGPSLTETLKALTGKEAGNPDARPSKPANEAAVIAWWKAEEGPRNVGRNLAGDLQPWFHGPIARDVSEAMLKGQPVGAFLIRISTRIWGYTISFVDNDRPKHFLIDAAEGQYSVFGAQTRSHKDLNSLVQFHEKIPVSKSGVKLTKGIGEADGNELSLSAYLEEMSL